MNVCVKERSWQQLEMLTIRRSSVSPCAAFAAGEIEVSSSWLSMKMGSFELIDNSSDFNVCHLPYAGSPLIVL